MKSLTLPNREHINVKGEPVGYRVVRSKRARKARITVGVEGVKVVLPERAEVNVQALIMEHADWVLRKRKRYQAYREAIPERRFEEGATFPFLGEPRKLRLEDQRSSAMSEVAFLLSSTRVEKTSLREELVVLYRREARRYFTQRIDHFSGVMNVSYQQIQIRNQKTRWGSYSQRTRTLSLNWRLMMAPPEIVDYLLVHELAHAAVRNHSRQFWHLVEHYMPDYQQKDKWLKENGMQLAF